MRDFKRLQHDPPAGISGAPQDNNIMLWNAVIFGLVRNFSTHESKVKHFACSCTWFLCFFFFHCFKACF